MELFIGQVTSFIAPFNFHSFNDQDSRSTIQYLRLNFFAFTQEIGTVEPVLSARNGVVTAEYRLTNRYRFHRLGLL